MKQTIKFFLITIVVLFSLYSITNLTGVLTIYNNSTLANEPNLKMNSKMLVTNLINPKIGDFVTFKFEDPMFGKAIRIFRLCGTENDVIEIRDGLVFLNKKNIDENINFTHRYLLTLSDYQNLRLNEVQLNIAMPQIKDKDSVMILFDDDFAKEKGFEQNRVIERNPDNYIKSTFNQNWNKDNFGPIRIPKGKVFLLGDNRDNSEDSRYLGFINHSDIVGTVIK